MYNHTLLQNANLKNKLGIEVVNATYLITV